MRLGISAVRPTRALNVIAEGEEQEVWDVVAALREAGWHITGTKVLEEPT